MSTNHLFGSLRTVFSELVDGASTPGLAVVLNSGDAGLLRSLEALSASDASRSVNDDATIAAHAEHLRYGLSLMNRWARDGGDPFADATWDAAWKLSTVDSARWMEIRRGLAEESARWSESLGTEREVTHVELCGMIGSIAHLAYHLGAIRQIHRGTRGPREGTFLPPS